MPVPDDARQRAEDQIKSDRKIGKEVKRIEAARTKQVTTAKKVARTVRARRRGK